MHEPDTSATNVAFGVPRESLADFERTLKPAAPDEVIWPRIDVNQPWWLAALNDRSHEEAQQLGLEFFTYEQGSGGRKITWGCAINRKSSKAYCWF